MFCTTLWRISPFFLFVPFILPVNVAFSLLLACTYVNRTCDDSSGDCRGTIIYPAIPLYKCLYVCIKEWTKYLCNLYKTSMYYMLCYFVLYLFYIKTIIMTYLFLNNKSPYTVQIFFFFFVAFSKLWHGYFSTLSVFLYFTLLKMMFWRAILFCVLFPFFRLMCVWVCRWPCLLM